MNDDPKTPPIGITFSLSLINYELVSERCKNRGDRSKFINSLLDKYRQNDSTREIEVIGRICDAHALDLIPILNNYGRDDIVFVMKKCREVGLVCNQYVVDNILHSTYPAYFREIEQMKESQKEVVEGF